MSDYGITPDEFAGMAHNAFESMGSLFENDRIPLWSEDCIKIYKESFK